MMTLAVSEGVGPIVIERYLPGGDRDQHATYFTAGTLSFVPGVTTTDLMGGDGTTVARVPTGATPTIAIEVSERYPQIAAGTLLGSVTSGTAEANKVAVVRESFLTVGDSLLTRSAAQAIIDGLTIDPAARAGVYELAVNVVATSNVGITVRRISPSPAVIDPTALFSDWATGTPISLVTGTPTANDTGAYFVEIRDPVAVSRTVDFSNPVVYHHRISAWSGQSGSNVSAYLFADPCVSTGEDPFALERGAVNTSSLNFAVLGASARLELVQFTKTIAASGLV